MIKILILLFFVPVILNTQQNELIKYPLDSDVEILYIGDYKKGELDVKIMNKEWWGLFVKNNISFVRKVKLRLDKLEADVQYNWEYRL